MRGDMDEAGARGLVYLNYAAKVQARYDQHRALYRMLMTTAEDAAVPHTCAPLPPRWLDRKGARRRWRGWPRGRSRSRRGVGGMLYAV
jgi:hypothetical protein